jgi:membrane-associated phospholipid phosphatase
MVGALAMFLLIAMISEPTSVDIAVYRLAGRLFDRRVERAQWWLEVLGLPGMYIPAAHLIARGLRTRGRRSRSEIVRAAWAAWLTVRVTRLLFHRPRPPRPPGRGPKRESTFPSGHTLGLTTLALATADALRTEGLIGASAARALRIGLPLAIGANRLYVREHWATDVAGAWALASAVAAGCRLPPTRGRAKGESLGRGRCGGGQGRRHPRAASRAT